MKQLCMFIRSGWRKLLTRVPQEYAAAFDAETLKENYARLTIVSVAVFFLEVILLLMEESLFHVGNIIFGFLISNVVLVPLILYINSRLKSVHRNFALTVQFAYALSVLIFGCALSLFVQQEIDFIHMYLMTVFGIVLFLYLKPVPTMVLFGSVYLVFAILLPYYQHDPTAVLVTRINALIFNIFAWIQGRMAMRARLSIFMSRQLLREKNEMLSDMAQKDSMTGLFNHAMSFRLLEDEIARAKEAGYPLSLIITDIDDFKQVNDTFGHLSGDHMIQKVADAITNSVRRSDIVGRYGGEEFIIILPHTDLPTARARSADIQTAISAIHGDTAVTISGGISQFGGESMNDFIRVTDAKLYQAKRNGKNRFETLLA